MISRLTLIAFLILNGAIQAVGLDASEKARETKAVELSPPPDARTPTAWEPGGPAGASEVGPAAVGAAAPAATRVTLVSSSDTATVFDVDFGDPVVSEVEVAGRRFSRYDVPGCSSSGDAGAPELEWGRVWVAVPEGADVSVSVEGVDYIVVGDVDLCPRPREEVVERDGYEALVDDFLYDGDAYSRGPYPAKVADVVTSARIRGLRVIRVGVYAYTYDPPKRLLKLHRKVRVRVAHAGGFTRSAVDEADYYSDDKFSGALSKNILNFETAAVWPRDAGTLNAGEEEVWAGEWLNAYKIAVSETSLYHMSYSYLTANGFDASVDPRNLHLYGWPGGELPKSFGDPVTGLEELPFIVAGEDDGRFDPDDFIEFFGHGTYFFEDTGNLLVMNRHNYTYYNFYWLVVEDTPGLRYTEKSGEPVNLNITPDEAFAWREYVEEDRRYEGTSDKIDEDEEKWFWFSVLPTTYHEESFTITGLDAGATDITMRFKFLLRSHPSAEEPHNTTIYVNERDEDHIIWAMDGWGPGQEMEVEVTVADAGIFREGVNDLYVAEGGADAEEKHVILFSHFEVEYPRSYSAQNDYLYFSNPPERHGDILFEVGGFGSSDLFVYDVTAGRIITDFDVEPTAAGYMLRFEDEVEEGRRWFVGCTAPAKSTPEGFYPDEPSSLRSGNADDLLIITNDGFYDNLLPLANLRRSQGLSVGMYKLTDVFDEFAGGVFDPVAVRNFVKLRYDNPATRPTYLLLVGDASYDYRDNYDYHTKEYRYFGGNLLPTAYVYTSANGDSASDNFFACVDGDDYIADLFVGRLGARFEEQVSNMVGKITAYDRSMDLGTWRTRSLLVADNYDKTGIEGDGGPGNFTKDYEVYLIPPHVPPGLGIDKMYIEWMNRAHPNFDYLLRDERRPLVRDEMTPDLVRAFDALLVQYSGHGGPQIWSHEDLFVHGAHDRYDIDDLTNAGRYPIIMEMSCTNSKFDDVPLVSEPTSNECINEYFMHPADRGAVGTTGSSRLGTEGDQADYLEGFYANLFPGQAISPEPVTLGEAFWGGKMYSDTTRLWAVYTLLGDPSMEVGVPRPGITDVAVAPNPATRGGVINVRGAVAGAPAGVVEVSLYDRPYYFTSTQSGVGDVHRERLLSRAVGDITAGRFDVDVPVPITAGWGYDGGDPGADIDDALVRVYAYNEADYTDYLLADDLEISIHGEADSDDTTGPVVDIYFDDYSFRSGDPVGSTPEVIISINDASGVMVSSYTEDTAEDFRPIAYSIDTSFGASDGIDVTKYFEPTVGDYRSGEVRRKISLTEGEHSVYVRAYDNLMNETVRSVQVRVAGALTLSDVYNCPNPFAAGGTYFTFVNSAHLDNVVVKVYTVTGKLIGKIEALGLAPGYNEVYWDGRDRDGDEIANGVYFYKIIARSGTDKGEVREKLIKMR